MKKKNLEEEMAILDEMLDSLIELLEEKGLITTKEWEAKIRARLHQKI